MAKSLSKKNTPKIEYFNLEEYSKSVLSEGKVICSTQDRKSYHVEISRVSKADISRSRGFR